MLFSIAVGLMVILVAAYWVYQGFLSGVIMFFECVIAAMIAFGFYESVNGLWAGALGNGLGQPLALMLLFFVVVVVLRVLTDKLITGNVKLPVALDRIGAGLSGFFSGMVLVGMALIGIQMLPISSNVFGWERVSTSAGGAIVRGGLFFKPDEFTLGLMNLLSKGRFGGGNPLAQAKPDLLMDLYCARSCTQTEDRHEIPSDALGVRAWWETREISTVKQSLENGNLVREFEVASPVGATKFIVVNVRVASSAAHAEHPEIRYRLPQFRLVGPDPATGGTPSVYPAIGSSDLYTHHSHNYRELARGQQRRLVRFNPETQFILTASHTKAVQEKDGTGYRFDVAFEVPENFTPWYIAFKRGPRLELTKKQFVEKPPAYASTASGGRQATAAADAPQVGEAPAGATHVSNVTQEGTAVTDTLPIALPKAQNLVQSAVQGDRIGDCHFAINAPASEPEGDDAVTQLLVPDGKKIVFLGAKQLQAESLFGKSLNYASNVAAQIKVTTDDGKMYYAQGVIAKAKVEGKSMIELQYHPEPEVPERCLAKPKRVTTKALQATPEDERFFAYIFVVDPGVKLVKFQSGGMGSTQQLNIVVPND